MVTNREHVICRALCMYAIPFYGDLDFGMAFDLLLSSMDSDSIQGVYVDICLQGY